MRENIMKLLGSHGRVFRVLIFEVAMEKDKA